MRLTVNLDSENYRLAKSLAREQDISISKAINLLLKKRIQPTSVQQNHEENYQLTPVAGKGKTVTSEDVARILEETP